MQAFLSLGGNLGNRIAYLKFAKYLINRDIGTILKESSIYETQALGDAATKPFLNQVIEISTTLSEINLLKACMLIEQKAGRTRTIKWSNRTLDIDILFYENKIINTPSLKLPHHELVNRLFVLIPLCEIAGEYIHPVLNKSIKTITNNCTSKLTVEIYKGK